MPWQVPITIDGLEYPVTFNTEAEPTQDDLNEAVQSILQQRNQAVPQPTGETPGYLSQLGTALDIGYRQMASGVGATFNALTGDTADVASEMVEQAKLQREQQAAQTPEDVQFMQSLGEAEKAYEEASGPFETIGALAQYPAAVMSQPGAAFKTAVQSAPNVLVSGATQLAGRAIGGILGGAAGIETGPGAILTGLAGYVAGGALSNTLMEAGPAIYDVLYERTQGAASNMTADQIAAYLKENPDVIDEGLKTGAVRGTVIGAVESIGMKGAGRLLTMPERAAARAVQKKLVDAGVDIASKAAVDKALLDPALRTAARTAADAAKSQFSSAGNLARLAGASAIETGAAGAGELAAQAAAGQEVSTKEAFLEMLGEVALSAPMAAATKTIEGAKYMLNPALQNPDTQESAKAANVVIDASASQMAVDIEASRPSLIQAELDRIEKDRAERQAQDEASFQAIRKRREEQALQQLGIPAEQLAPAPTPITPAPEPEPIAEPPVTPSPLTGQPTAPAVETETPTTPIQDATIQREIPEDGQQERVQTDEGGPPAETGGGYSPVVGRQGKAEEEVDRSVALPPPPEGVDSDIIDYILGNWSIESVGKKQRDKRRATGEVEAFERLSQGLSFPARNILFSPDRGRNLNRGNLDVIAQAAFERNLIPSPDANALTDEILKAYNARKSGKSPFAEMRQQEEAAEQRTLEFEKAARERTAPLTLMPASDLEIGDVVQIGDDNMRVTFTHDQDGYLTAAILTGPKFGEQRVDLNKPLKAEKLDTTNRVQDTSEFVSEEELEGAIPEAPPAAAPTEAPQPSPNLPALIAVRDNTATPEQVQSLVEQGLVEQVDGQNIITEAGVAAMPEGERPKLTPAERRAEVEEMWVPVVRDVTKPEQMTPEERFNRPPVEPVIPKSFPIGKSSRSTQGRLLTQFNKGLAWAEKNDSERASLSAFQKRNDLLRTRDRTGNFGTDRVADDYAFWKGASAFFEAKQINQERVNERNLPNEQKVAQHVEDLLFAFDSKEPVSAEAVDAYGIKLPEGYVRQGDLYVFQPEAPATQPPAAEPVTPEVTPEVAPEVTTPEAKAQQEKGAREAKKLENESRASLARLVAGERGNPVFGNVTMDDGIEALRQLDEAGDLPNIFFTEITTTQEFLSKPENEQNFPDTWAALSAGGKAEGMEEKGTAFVFIDNVGVTNLDRKLATQFGTTPEVAAVRRVATHESIHKAISFLNESEQIALFRYLRELYSPEQLDVLAETYTNFANWRESKSSYLSLIEESLTRTIDSMESLPKDGILGEFIQWLKGIWRKITGKKGEPTLNDMKDVMRLIRNGLRNSTKARADRTISGGVVRYSAVAPQAPATDAEYLAAVEAGDMEKAQRMVDEAAKAAGYLPHGDFRDSHAAPSNQLGTDEDVRNGDADASLVQVARGVHNQPDDYFDPRVGPRYYSYQDKAGMEAFKALRAAMDKIQRGKKTLVIVYRAVPIDIKGTKLENRDWVTPSKTYAVDHGESRFGEGEYRIIKESVPAENLFWDGNDIREWGKDDAQNYFYKNTANNIKSADPVTRDNAGNVIPLSQRFQTASPDIRFSLPTLVSESASAFSSGQQAARAISFTPRQLDVYMAVLGAFSTLRRKGKQSATMQELFDAANTLVSGITPNEFSETLQGLYNDNAALLNPGDSTFQVFNRDGELAGAVVLVAKDTSRASLIPPEEIKGITDKLTSDMDKAVTEGEQSPFEGLSFTGNVPKMHARVNFRNVEKAAEDFVNQMIRSRKEKGRTYIEALIDIADMVATDNFTKEYIGGAGMESQGLVLQAIPPPLNNKIYAAQMTNISEADRVRLEDAYRKVSLYYEGIGTVGGTLQGYRAWTATRGKYGWLLDSWKADALKTAEYAVNAQMGGSVSVKINQDLNDAVTGVGKAVADEVSGIVEEDAEMELLREGEAELDDKRRTIWERIKLLIRRRAMFARRKTIKAASAARASLSKAEVDELNAILAMSDEEAAKAEAKDLAELDKLMAEFLGEDKPTDTPAEKAKKGKRKGMIKAAEKIIFREGKDVEFRNTSIQEAVADLFNGADEYGKIVEEVGNALLSRVKQAKGMGGGQTAIKQLVESIKKNLLGNLPTPKPAPPTNATLGKMLAMTFSQQIREARLYADAWSKGRTEVRNLLAETGLEGEALENELDAIMPPTPTLAYAPNAAKRAIALAMEQAGVTREELTDARVNVSNEAKAKVMAAFDAAAAAANLSTEGWSTQGATGRQLAERALNEAVKQWIIQASNRVKISSIVAEQADNPVSIEAFAQKLSQFNLTPKQVKRYFDIAARAAVRRVEINNEKAKRIIYERGDIRPDVAEKDVDGDTVIEAFRDQVNSPTEEQAFLERLSKLGVAENVAKDLFNTAARERRDRQRTRVFDMIEGKNAIQKMLREIALMRRGIEMPLRNPIPWTELLSKPAKSVDEYRQRVLDGILANPDMESVDNDVKERIADMFTDLWQEQVDKAVNRVIDNYTLQLERAQRRQAGEALNKSRSKVIQHLNLGVLSNDAFIRILGEKFGIKMEMTKEERKHIESLLATLQDESLPKNKRNQASDDLASALMQYTKVGWSARLSLFWAMSVLAGWNTMLAIGMSFMNGANIILVRTPIGILSKMAQGDFKGALDVTFDSLNDMKRYLEAFPEAVDRAWGYITSGKVDLLEAEAAAPDRLFKSWDSLAKYRKVADQMVQDPKMLVRWMGTFMRMIGRIMTALDGFNTIVTKRGHLSMAVRLVAPDKEAFDRIIAKGSIEHYRQMLLASDPYFANMTPEKRRLLNSTAEAMMYQAMNEEGAKLENADFYASESAFTMDPSGLGGMIYGAIKKAEETSKSFAERNLAEKRLEAQGADRLSLENAKLATAYITHFLAYNAVNYVGLRFARFAANKFNQGLSFIPFLGLTRFWEKSNSKLVDRQEAFTEMIYRNQAVGAVFAILGAMLIRALNEEPDDEKRGWFINGGLENVPTAQRRQLQEGGKLQYRLGVKINGRWLVFSYQNWPWSQLFSALGSTSDMIRFSPEKWREKGTSDILLSVAASGLTSTLDLPALQGLGTVLGRSISSSDPAEDFWTNIGAASANWVGGFIPKPLMDLDYILDSNRRKYTTIWEKTAGVVPFYRRYVGEDYYNILGDPIKRNALPGSREFLLGPTEPAYKILGALNSRDIWLTPANAEQRMVGKGRNRRRLTQQEADAYSLETGKAYKTMILRYGPRALKMSPERARAFLSDKADEVRDRVLMKVYRGYRSRPSAQ